MEARAGPSDGAASRLTAFRAKNGDLASPVLLCSTAAVDETWTEADIPDVTGRTILITGANSGLGYEAARAVAVKGASAILACRDIDKATNAAERIEAEHPRATTAVLELDLADLSSVREAAKKFESEHERLDVLINNAGIMAVPYAKTADGFEKQLGVCHFGHFALTGLLLDKLLTTASSRVVTISSGGHRMGQMDFDDLAWERRYMKWPAYGRAKLANLLFTYELQRRLDRAGWSTAALAAHPGASSTNLGYRAPGTEGAWVDRLLRPVISRVTQSAAMGALPTLRAATDPQAAGGEYYGPDGFMELQGHPVRVRSNRRSRDEAVAERLWRVSKELTGVSYDAIDTVDGAGSSQRTRPIPPSVT